jgi:cell division protein FtsB
MRLTPIQRQEIAQLQQWSEQMTAEPQPTIQQLLARLAKLERRVAELEENVTELEDDKRHRDTADMEASEYDE